MSTENQRKLLNQLKEEQGLSCCGICAHNLCIFEDREGNMYIADMYKPHESLLEGPFKELGKALLTYSKHGRLPNKEIIC